MLNKIKNLILVALLATLPLIANQDISSHKIVRRVAFDIGSGKIKMQVADVDLTINKIVNVLLTDTAKVPLREDLAKSLDGRLSLDMQNKTVQAISQLMEKTLPYHPEAYHAIATEPFRLAKNGTDLAKKIKQKTGLSVTIVSQEEEGILGFTSAINATDANPENAIVWDFGGGSFQITAKCGDNYSIYQGTLGKVPLKQALLNIQRRELLFSPNPISKAHADEAIQFIKASVKNIPAELRQTFHRPDVRVLGVGINPLWVTKQRSHFDKIHVLTELESRLNLTDEEIRIKDAISHDQKEAAVYIVSNLILAYGIMEAFGITQVHYVGTQGANAVGVLLSPQYWQDDSNTINSRN
jgi:exopolyphosphatase/guanosine-5'-triphosphate,3'-diphosphate pyrophosphatase